MSAKRIKSSFGVYIVIDTKKITSPLSGKILYANDVGINSIANVLLQSPITITKRNLPYCLLVKYIYRLRHNLSDKQIILKFLIIY